MEKVTANMANYRTNEEKVRILKDAFYTLQRNGVVKTWQDFAQLLGVNRTSLSNAKNGAEAYLTNSLMEKVDSIMRNIKGGVTISNSPNSIAVQGDNNNISNVDDQTDSQLQQMVYKCVPTIPIKAYRAINFDVMEYFRTTTEYIHLTPIITQFPSTDCYYFVNSSDMSPNLEVNDLLCLARLPKDAKVTNGDLCIINTKYQGMLERFVYDDGDNILVKSTQARWTDMRIPKEEVFSIFRILGGIRTNI